MTVTDLKRRHTRRCLLLPLARATFGWATPGTIRRDRGTVYRVGFAVRPVSR